MTNLYETLGVVHTATIEDIEKAFDSLGKYFDPARNPTAAADDLA